ncbi:MAG TPA: 8-amino-7-oxononanoate synthase [Deltaproteobacteria bacterium]|nr:MAG: 8-amino-7-oxononanoate synthase [Deltaproteobacteria bacterium GWA2_55_82]OGQ63984.1 MAG: 8-amino-7-oxononanoate synthase [Deltaproteobacteria bacterium RIFCSPLOWO2_02_FULL_55_12]OIJ73417.1 MAG: 8-amino-7-oxononanoate synthase [Deltaproteobacteria bacterium GWC2_55_46]HBG47280.1 8-amino-7-oxononanoate synthase [Deltaproteobacteria bacterium]HCY10046.1 8-amino-7-oxononanoate synthase [Deltaproteobacteria bacterium]
MKNGILEELDRLSALGLKRALTKVEGPQGPRVRVDGREVLLMCSNDYLGLADHPLVKEAAIKATERWGAGAGASRLVSGSMEPHMMLEERIRRFKGAQAALLFNSGYSANLGAISALADRTTEIFSDRLNHASIVDACVLSRARVRRYPNRDVDSLDRLLKASRAKKKLIVTDSVFSMDGTIAPLKEIISLLDKYNAMLLVDDAHATGVLGSNGRGSLEDLQSSNQSIIQMGTLGKALGSFGAFIAGSKDIIEFLITKSRPFIYTTALPPSVCAAAAKAIDIIEEGPEIIERLWRNTRRLKKGLNDAGLDTMGSATPIIPVKVGDAKKTMEASGRLLEKGVFIQGIRPPTVPEGASRLRATVSAAHTDRDIDLAVSAITEAFDEC